VNAITPYAEGFSRRNAVVNNEATNQLKKSMQVLLLATIFVCAAAFSASLFGEGAKGATRAAEKITGKLIVSGPGTMAPMIMEIAKRFEALHPGAQVEIHDTRTSGGRGLSDLRQGKAAIGMLTRALSDKETDLTAYPVARDGVCLIVHKDNRVSAITSQQVVDIYLGKIVNWDKVGGAHVAIDAISGDSNSSATEVFVKYFKLKNDQIKPRLILSSSAERIKAVAENRNAVSYASIGELQRNIKAGAPVKSLPAEGVSATARSLRSGNFPIGRPLSLVTMGAENELTKAFIRYALSPNAAGIIETSGFVPYQD
jgi:phosphate transport system substrate-binding protein